MTITSKNNNNNNSHTPSNIIFECSDIRHDIGLMITTSTSNTTITNYDKFQLHLDDGYNDIALVINMDIRDFANMCYALGPYFQHQKSEIEI